MSYLSNKNPKFRVIRVVILDDDHIVIDSHNLLFYGRTDAILRNDG